MTSKLCDDCSKLIAEIRPAGGKQGTHEITSTKHNFHINSQNGCAMCTHMLLGFDHHENSIILTASQDIRTSYPRSSFDFRLVNGFLENAELLFSYKYGRDSLDDGMRQGKRELVSKSYAIHPLVRNKLVLDDLVIGGTNSHAQFDLHRMEISHDKSTGSGKTKELIKGWLSECSAGHKNCNMEPVFGMQNPTRLIYVGTEKEPVARLLNGANSPESLVYATLSHCWGKVVPFRLLISNIEELKHEIPFDELSRTFREAIQVTRKLSVRYLWIDSLCIIQDSKIDWLMESTLMDSVYSNAIFNIAATSAKNGHEGLYRERRLQDVELCKFEAEWTPTPGINTLLSRKLWQTQIEESPLRKRSWVLQEMYLSRRNIHFGKTQVFWECREASACEMLPTGCSYFVDNSSKLSPFKYNTPIDRESSSFEIFQAMVDWDKIVLTYTRSSLTFGDDKLVAISALARYWQRQWKEPVKYYAGIWDIALLHQLMWTAAVGSLNPKDGLTRLARQKGYRAPTWSWASVDGPIKISSYSGTPLAPPNYSLLVDTPQIEIDLVSDDQFGQVRGGRLKISSRLAHSVSVHNRGKPVSYKLGSSGIPIPGGTWLLPDVVLADDDMKSKTLVLMPLMSKSHINLPKKEEFNTTFGLLLQRVEDKVGTFERFGIFDLRKGSDADQVLFEEALVDFDLHANQSGLSYTVDKNNKKRYDVVII
ncbi:hypothetical protein GLAREA_03027 [Glarea lozoyensis ATCC 20868]|uniref:Heterokaryon incompatibility domain-containing protein n=1 Tax=Glarea lozoyensis (strain ATCC 20868 / MF5171) TaxID=1116229 RepID=S3DKM2_GLAL2|nr:uncharacterized protein GLAREA_03027 [Glarea lozoyensis ATCC 20868]EPE27113.1 hypothetical protein GLAREA_03027 [Glarea lozoyensis ATCC 20868]